MLVEPGDPTPHYHSAKNSIGLKTKTEDLSDLITQTLGPIEIISE